MHLLYLPSEYSSVPRQLESNCSILCVCSQIFERDAILRQLQSLSDCKSIGKRQYNDFTIRFFSYRGRCIAVAVSGKNFLSTSLRLSKLFLLLPNVEKVFFVGIGGSLNPNLKPGDVCIPEKWACHTVGYVYNKTTNKTHAVRYEPELPHYKDFYPTSTEIGVASNDEIVRAHFLACTPSLFTAVQAILPPPHSVHNFDVHCGGIGVSGTMFVDSDKYRQHLSETYNAQVVDMESFPFAAACYEFQKLFCVIRGISDLAGVFNDGNLGNTIDDSRNLAADNAALVFAHILRRIPLSKTNYSKIPLRLIQQYLFPSKNPECTINNVPHSPKVNACFQ
ncbi:MAG: 5'-methylthioadenosine/S-adenosylhomocysteine nucleosidase [Puniceicoccales bacterium]|jgi:adenosylhomocysteine nucleosidase|nr:5'-methylthioadenosine/S-adenosylhomocysteine nucleosidase [Puniceicoccales bacterium]